MENRMDSIKTPVIPSSVDKLIDIKYKRRSSRLQNLQITESDSKDSSLKSSISALENNRTIVLDNDRTNEQGTSTSGLCVTPDQPSTNFDCEISNELNILEQHSKEKYLKKYTNSKYYTDNNYEDTEDVSKVFKLISKSNFNSNVKSSPRSTLKTYTNPRKSLGKNEVVESFGLPDTPIIPEKPLVNSNLDAEVLDAKEITIQELQFVDEPWCIIEFEENFTNPHEIRIKPDPQTDIKSCHASTINENVVKPGFQSSHTLLNIVQKSSSIVDMLDGHTKRSKKDSKKILRSPSKSEISIENNSLAPEGHEVEICKVNSFPNTSSCKLSTVDTNKLPQAKTKKVKDINYNERRTIRSNINKYSIKEMQLDGNVHDKKSLRGGVEDNSAIESRKLRSSNIIEDASTLETEMQRKADRAEVKNNYEVIYNELGNSSGIRKLRSSGIHHTKVFNIEIPKIKITTKCDSTSNEGNASFNDNEEESQETKKIISADSKEIHDNTLLKSIEIGKLLSPNMSSDLEATSETKYNISESNANKIYNQFKDSIHSTPEHSIIIKDSVSPNLRTSMRRDKFNIAKETVLKSFVSKEFISDSHTPSKKYNLRSNEQCNTPSNEKREHKFASPKKVPSILDTSTRNIELNTTLKNRIKSTPKKTFRYTNTTVDSHEAEIQSDISEMESTTSTRILRTNSCPEIVLHPKSLENSKSTKVSKLQNHEVMASKGIEHKGLDDYYCLRKPKNDPILPTKEKQLKVILHPLKRSFNAYTNRRKDHVNNKTRNKKFSTIHTPKHVTNIEKSSRSCEMLLEIVDIIPVSDKPKTSSKLLQSKPFLNLFKNTELPLPETLLVEGEIKKTSNSRKPEPKIPVKNRELLSSTSNENNKNDRSKSTIKDTNLICQLSKCNFKLMQNNKNKDSMISPQEVTNIDSYIEVSHSCKSDTPPEKTNIIEQMQTSPIKSEVKTTNKLKKSPESKAEFTELKNLIKKISEVEGRKCKMLTNEKLSECLKSRSYHKKSCNDDMSSVNTEPANDFLQQTIENKSDGPHNTSKEKSLIMERKQPLTNMSPTDKLRNRTRKIIEMLSEDITNPLIQESRSATFKKTFSSVQLENTPLKNDKDLIVNYSNSQSSSCEIIVEDEMNKTPTENNEKELLENVETACPKFQNILMNDESVKLLDKKVCRVALDFKPSKLEVSANTTKLATFLNNDKNTMITKKNKSDVADELETHETSLTENVKYQVNSSEQSKNVSVDTLYCNSTNTSKYRELRKREEKCIDKPKTPRKFSQKGTLVLETKSLSENITNMLETPSDGSSHNEAIKKGRGRPRKSPLVKLDNKLDGNNSKLNKEITNFNAHLNICNENIFNGSSESNSEKNVTNILATNNTDISIVENNYDHTKNILKSEETTVIKYLPSDIILEDEMNKTPIENNEKELLENIEISCPKFQNILMNKESVKLLDEKVCRVALDFKPCKPAIFLNNDKNTMIIEKNNDAEENKETILETSETSLMENVKSQVNSSEQSKNVAADTLYSNSTNSAKHRELRKREEKCVDRPKTPRKFSQKGNLLLETMSPSKNITNIMETPTDTIKRGRGRPRKSLLVELDNKIDENNSKPNEEINFNAHINIFNGSSESDSEKNVTNILSTNSTDISRVENNYVHPKNILKSEETAVIEHLPSDIILEDEMNKTPIKNNERELLENVEMACPKFQNILMNNESVKLLDEKVCRVALNFKPSKPEVSTNTSKYRELRKREEKCIDKPKTPRKFSQKGSLVLETKSPSENITNMLEPPTDGSSHNGAIKTGRGRPRKSPLVKLDNKLDGNDSKLNKEITNYNAHLNIFNGSSESNSEKDLTNILSTNNRDISRVENNYDHTKNILKSEETTVKKYLLSDTTLEHESNKTPIENNEKELLENVETACPKFQNILMNKESVKLLDEKVCRVALDFKPCKPEVNTDSTKLATFLNNDKNTMITEKNKTDVAEENKETILETRETSLMKNVKSEVNSSEQSKNISADTSDSNSTNSSKRRELRKREEKCVDKPKTPRKLSKKGNLVLETISPNENITNMLETPTDGSTHNDASKRGSRSRPRKLPLVKLNNKLDVNDSKLNEEINFNVHLNISNEIVFNESSEICTSNSEENITLSTNNRNISNVVNSYDHTKNILKSEETPIIKYLPSAKVNTNQIEDITAEVSISEKDKDVCVKPKIDINKSKYLGANIAACEKMNIVTETSAIISNSDTKTELESSDILVVTNMPPKIELTQKENNTSAVINVSNGRHENDKTESTEINKDDKTKNTGLNKVDKTESKNSTIDHTEINITENTNVNKYCITKNTVVIKNNIKSTYGDKSGITDTFSKGDTTESIWLNKKYTTESTKVHKMGLKKRHATVKTASGKGKLTASSVVDKIDIIESSETKDDNADNECTVQTDSVKNINTSTDYNTNILNEENTLKNNACVVNNETDSTEAAEKTVKPVIDNLQLNKECTSKENDDSFLEITNAETYIQKDLVSSPSILNTEKYELKKYFLDEENNQQNLMDREVSTNNENLDRKIIKNLNQEEVKYPLRLRSKTSLGQRSSASTDTSKKSRHSEEFSHKTPNKQRDGENEEQHKCKRASPRIRNNSIKVSKSLIDGEIGKTRGLRERSTDLEIVQYQIDSDEHSGMKNISTRTRSKTSLGERIDGNLDEDFIPQNMTRSKSSLGVRINDNEYGSFSHNITQSTLATTAAGISANIQCLEILDMIEKGERTSRSKSMVATAEYLDVTTCVETDSSEILLRKSLVPVDRKVVKRSKSIGDVQDTNKLRNITRFRPKIGDIVWAQIGKYPFWPSLVSKDPVTCSFKNNMKNRCMYHVKFFGDMGRRAWISGKKLMEYKSRDDLKMCYNNLKNYKSGAELQAYIIRTYVVDRWTRAVDEVEFVKSQNFTFKQIINYMDTMPDKEESNQEPEEEKHSTLKKERKRRQSLSLDDLTDLNSLEIKKLKLEGEELVSTSKEKSRQKRSSKGAETEDNCINFSSPELKCEDSSTSKIDEKTEDFIVIKDEQSDMEYKINLNTFKNFGSYTLEEQRSLFKRNNLFKGIPKEKVCQYCFDFGELLKCKGGCNGNYHPYCATRVLEQKHPKTKKARRSLKIEHTEKVESIKIEKIDPPSSPGNQLEVDNNHVQIVTIPSNVYNTPPRKTFPPDFENMTLGERIDFKMKEIMKKFESTTYTEVLNESPSEEKSTTNKSLVCGNFSAKCQDLFSAGVQRSPQQNIELDKELDSMLKPIEHVTADSSENIVKSDTDSLIKHVTADSEYSSDVAIKNNASKKEIQNQSKQRNSLVKHITADSPLSRQSSTDNKDFPNEPVKTKTFNGHKKSKHVTTESDNVDSESLRSSSSGQSKQSDVSENSDTYRNINPKNFKCGFCAKDVDPYCFICNETMSKKGSHIRQKCSLYQCARFYHPECLKLWPQTQWSVIQTTKNRYSQEEVDSFVCPQHVCHTCASDDPRAALSRCSWDKIVKCLCCPASYHSTNLCVPAGTEIITSTQIICPRHRNKYTKPYTINTTWCLLCNEGGKLICCETCPTSVHTECMTVNLTDDDKFICEDCESGRLPLYDEVVWVKLGYFKWWPALIIFPNEVPQNVFNAKHSLGEFVVKFFGTYNYYWMNRGRAFLFQEGDNADTGPSTKKKVEAAFQTAVEEAVIAHKMKKQFKLTQSAESVNSMKPPPYIKIKVSKPVGNVRFMDLDLSNTTACDCNPSQPNPCGPDSNCLNRLLLTECNPEVCPAGKLCNNQSFEKREYPLLVPYKTETRGWGLKTLEPVKKGQFVIEYVGELIDDEEYQRRILKMHAQKEENYYFLTIHKDRMIDAGPKGNMARFMNHCCQPNCETQKWTVNGDTRVGLFATTDIPAHTELTFNYNLECTGTEKKVCQCGAPNCSGFIGVKVKNESTENKKPKKERKKKEPEKPLDLPPCFLCQKKGNVSLCNNKICNKAYHLRCLKLEVLEGKKFICPWHYCNICSKRTIRCCVKCLNSFCPSHSEGNVRYDNLLGFVCSTHDPNNAKAQTSNVTVKRKRNHQTTDDAVVTSTTDDNDDEDDDVSLLQRMRQSKKNGNNGTLEEEKGDLDVSGQEAKEAVSKSQNETVSSAIESDFGNELKQKRKKKTKRRLLDKRLKFKNERIRPAITANSVNESNVSDATR